jgi:hypothetical protein
MVAIMLKKTSPDSEFPSFRITPLIEDSLEQHRHLASIVDSFLERKKWKQEALADTYNEVAKKDYPNSGIAQIRREHVNRLLGCLKPSIRPRRLPALHKCMELEVWAKVLETSPEILLGLSTAMANSDPQENARHVEVLSLAMARRQQEAQKVTGWAMFLPCSLVSDDFMTGHHRGLYPGCPDVQNQWNRIGKKRRNGLLSEGKNRPWLFRHLMFRSDLERIAQGRDEFRLISPEVRRACFGELIKMVGDQCWKIHLAIAEDRPELREAFLGYDSIVAMDSDLVILRDFFGITYYSEEPLFVYPKLGLLEQFRKDAEFREPDAVVHLLERIVQQHL